MIMQNFIYLASMENAIVYNNFPIKILQTTLKKKKSTNYFDFL